MRGRVHVPRRRSAKETVNVRLDLSEGPRQVVRAVVVEGASRTHPAVVRTVLDIELGAPVHPAAWSRARRRLYDTGVFRSVVSARADRDQQALRAAERTVRLPGSSIP